MNIIKIYLKTTYLLCVGKSLAFALDLLFVRDSFARSNTIIDESVAYI